MENKTAEESLARAVPTWVPLILVAWVTAVLTGGLSWIAFQANASYNTHASVASNQAEIAALEDREHAIEASLATLPSVYVSQQSFAEFKAAYIRDQAEGHDFRVRMDVNMQTLLAEHSIPKPDSSKGRP